jgi:hypothetical protein
VLQVLELSPYRLRLALGLWLLAALLPAHAQAQSPVIATPLGTELAEQGDWQLYATLGVPELEVGGVTGVTSAMDFATRLAIGYGESLRFGGFSARASAGVRLRLGRTHDITWQLRAEPGLSLHVGAADLPPYARRTDPTVTVFAVDTGTPALAGGMWLSRHVHATIGVAAPLRIHVAPAPLLEVPVQLQLSAQAKLNNKFWLLLAADIGTHLYGPGAGDPSAATLARARVGLTF